MRSSGRLKVTPDRFVYYDTEQLYCFSVGLEDKASSVIALADYLVPTWPDVSFGGALLWIRQQGIWGDFSETTGAVILEQMRLAKGECTCERAPRASLSIRRIVRNAFLFCIASAVRMGCLLDS